MSSLNGFGKIPLLWTKSLMIFLNVNINTGILGKNLQVKKEQLKVCQFQRFLASSFTTKCDPFKSKFPDSYFNIQVVIICMLIFLFELFFLHLGHSIGLLEMVTIISHFLDLSSMLLRYKTHNLKIKIFYD